MTQSLEQPDFVAQTAEPMNRNERFVWFQARVDEFKAQGATWLQYSVDDPINPTISLVEAWKVRPEDQPYPFFQMVKEEAHGRTDRTST